MEHHHVRKRSNLYVKAGVLACVLAAGLIMYQRIITSGALRSFIKAFEPGGKYTGIVEFTEAQRDSVLKAATGFWEYRTKDGPGPRISDRLEITANGYIWQVIEITMPLPSGAEKHLTHAVHAYFHPSSRGVDDTTYVSGVVRLLNQVWIVDRDTCEIRKYVNEEGTTGSFKDIAGEVYIHESAFIMDGRKYVPYAGTAEDFFPKGIIDFVYNLAKPGAGSGRANYTINRGEIRLRTKTGDTAAVDLLTMPKECRTCVVQADFLRKAIGDDLQENAVQERSRESIINIVKNYYRYVDCIAFPGYGPRSRIQPVTIAFAITPAGSVEDLSVRLKGNAMDTRWQENALEQNIRLWKFQPLAGGKKTFRVSFDDTLVTQ
jgi:hypothetical protein